MKREVRYFAQDGEPEYFLSVSSLSVNIFLRHDHNTRDTRHQHHHENREERNRYL